MNIEQKAREIAESVRSSSFLQCYEAVTAARLGIIEGLKMALVELEKIAHWGAGDLTLGDAEEAIRALIEEQKV